MGMLLTLRVMQDIVLAMSRQLSSVAHMYTNLRRTTGQRLITPLDLSTVMSIVNIMAPKMSIGNVIAVKL
jgi:hypothetical protein